jgi:2'-hydroxyisoflavone reductase
MNRRQFVAYAGAAGGAFSFGTRYSAAQDAGLRLLILGGTGSMGPWFVRAALARGHRVAVFSRGQRQADLPGSVERLTGDRSGKLESIRNRDWDAIIDIATFGPGWVRSLAEAFGGKVRHYTFISTVSVYADPPLDDTTTEDSPVLKYTGTADPYQEVTEVGAHYGALKVLCEREAEKQFPGRTLVLRPGYVGGPGDSRALTYWAVRARKGGDMLAGGEASAPVQYIDVRDLAEWAIRLVEKRTARIFNAVGPAASLTVGGLVETARRTFAPGANVTWAPDAWLLSQNDPERWGTLLFFTRAIGNIMRMNNERALAAGLTTRPLESTLRDAVAGYEQLPKDQQSSLITGFKRNENGTFSPAMSTWQVYLQREKELLGAWSDQKSRRAARVVRPRPVAGRGRCSIDV